MKVHGFDFMTTVLKLRHICGVVCRELYLNRLYAGGQRGSREDQFVGRDVRAGEGGL